MKNITHNDLVSYLETLCIQYKDTLDFYRMDITEIQGKMRSGIEYPCMAMESHEIDFSGSKPFNSIINKTFAFSILHHPEKKNYDQQNDYLDRCEKIGLDIISRIRYDEKKANHFLNKTLEYDSIRAGKVGPIYSDHLYGYRFEITLKLKSNLKIDPNHWKDIDTVC